MEEVKKTYDLQQEKAHGLISQINKSLVEHKNEKKINYGHVGEITHVCELLKEIVEFLEKETE